MLRGAFLVVLVVLTMLTASTAQRGCQDAVHSLTTWSYPPIRDMRTSVALMPQKGVLLQPDSLSVPIQGLELPPVGPAGKPLTGLELTNTLAATLQNPVASDDSSIARGRRKFMRTCVPCHGQTLKGDGPVAARFLPPPDLLAPNSRGRKDGFIYSYIRNGGSIMPSYGAIVTAQEAWDLVNFIRHEQQVNPR